MRSLHTQVSQETSLTVLCAVLLTSAFVVVLPVLSALRAAPAYYYDLVSQADTADTDGDGIPDIRDATPSVARVHAAAPARKGTR